MTRRRTCPREPEVLDLVAIGQWPVRADRALTDHVDTCPVCRDLSRVAAAISNLNDTAFRDASLPDASTVWYRADARRRQEHARQAARPVTLVFVITAVSLLGVAAAGWFFVQSSLVDWWRALPSWPSSDALLARFPVWQAAVSWGWVGAAVLGWLAAVPVLFYLSRVADRGPEVRDH